MLNKIYKLLIKSPVTLPARRLGGQIINQLVRDKYGIFWYANHPEDKALLDQVAAIKKETEFLTYDIEAYQLITLLQSVSKIKGDIAEVGVYQGGSAKLMCKYKQNKKIHLFDTFAGLPTVSKLDNQNQFRRGMYQSNYKKVKAYLSSFSDVYIYKGKFPDTASPIRDNTFSFVNLDVDIYQSTLASLEFFYPRMSIGGIIVSHDYRSAVGVRKAFEEYFNPRKTPVIPLVGTQCMVVKT